MRSSILSATLVVCSLDAFLSTLTVPSFVIAMTPYLDDVCSKSSFNVKLTLLEQQSKTY